MKTNTELKQLLAKMLPELIKTENGVLMWHNKHTERFVLDTELLHLCREVRKNFTREEVVMYLNTLRELIGGKVSDYDIADAEWNLQLARLAEVKGIEI